LIKGSSIIAIELKEERDRFRWS